LRPEFAMIMAALTCCGAYGQTADASLAFDVASIKPAALPTADGRGRIMFTGPSGGPGTNDPGRIHYPYSSLRNLLVSAYNVKGFQISGPPWLDTERFEITATMPPETTKEQFRLMLQNLLIERFKMVIHRETKELPMYSLVVAKNGPKLKESVDEPPPQQDAAGPAPPDGRGGRGGPMKMDQDGFPMLPPGMAGRAGLFTMMMPGRARLMAQKQTMDDLASTLTNQLARPVTNLTGLKGKYDFTLTFLPEGMAMAGPMGLPMPPPPPPPAGAASPNSGAASAPDVETAPGILNAIQAQLGLRLDAKKGPVELIVVDKAEKAPTDN
jgi:uncharacterized protein (TIGR03435 family)